MITRKEDTPPSGKEYYQLPDDLGKTPLKNNEDDEQTKGFPEKQESRRLDKGDNHIGCQLIGLGRTALLILALCIIAVFAKGSQNWQFITWALAVMLGQTMGMKLPPHNPLS